MLRAKRYPERGAPISVRPNRPGPNRPGHSLSQPIGARWGNMHAMFTFSALCERKLRRLGAINWRIFEHRMCMVRVLASSERGDQGAAMAQIDACELAQAPSGACDSAKRSHPKRKPELLFVNSESFFSFPALCSSVDQALRASFFVLSPSRR